MDTGDDQMNSRGGLLVVGLEEVRLGTGLRGPHRRAPRT